MPLPERPSPASGLSWPALRRCAIETTAALAVLVALDRFALHGALAGISPHPFWIIVLVAACQYGAPGGAIAATAASLALYAGGLPPHGALDFYQYAAMITAQPALWFLAAATLGGMRSLHIRSRSEIQARLDEALAHARTIADGFRRACAENLRLEARIASDTATVDTILRDLAALSASDQPRDPGRFTDLIDHCLGSAPFTLWLFPAGGLTADAPEVADIPLPAAAATALLLQQRMISGDLLPPEMLVAAPVAPPGGEEVAGILIIWRADMDEAERQRLCARAGLVAQAISALLPEPRIRTDPAHAQQTVSRYSNAL